MIRDLTEYIKFLMAHNLTPEQFLFAYCLALDATRDSNGNSPYSDLFGSSLPIVSMLKYQHKTKAISRESITDLVKRGYLIDRNDRGDFHIDNFEVTSKFTNPLFGNSDDFIEFMDLYPAFHTMDNGRMIPLKGVPEETIRKLYRKHVGTKSEHSRMMRSLRWAVDKNIINLKISTFLEVTMWRDIEKIMEEGSASSKWTGVNV